MADVKVSELPSASSPQGGESVMLLQDAASKKTPAREIAKIGYQTVVNEAGTNRTLALTDIGSYIRMTNSAANSITAPTNANVAFPVGTVINAVQAGTGKTSVVASAGVTINRPAGTNAAARGKGCPLALIKVGTDEWDLFGDLEASA